MAGDLKPTAQAVALQREHLLDVWSNARKKWAKLDTYINGTFPVWDSPYDTDRPSFRPARARSILDHAVDNQIAFEPTVQRPPHTDSERSKEHADNIEPFISAVFLEASLLEPTLTFKQVARHLLGYGYAVLGGPFMSFRDRPQKPVQGKTELVEEFKERLTIYEHEKRTWMPFRLRAPHPSKVLLDPLEKNPSIAIVYSKRYAIDLQRNFEARHHRPGVDLGDMYEVGDDPYAQIYTDEVFTHEWHAIFLEGGKMLFIEPNEGHFIPFNHAFSGFGQEPTESPQGIDPAHLAVGILDPILETLKASAQAQSAIHNALIEAAYRRMMVKSGAKELAAQQARGSNIIERPEGKDSMWWEDLPDLPQWMFQALSTLDQDIELGTFSKQLAGIRETGVVTVGQQAILSTAAAHKFIAPTKQIEHLATNAASHILRLVDVLNEPMTVRGISIKPSDIEHDYSILVQFELLDPVLQMQERNIAIEEVDRQLLSKPSYWARTRLEDVSGEQRRLDEDAARALPEVALLRQRKILREWGLFEELEQLRLEEEALAAEGGPTGITNPSKVLGPDGRRIESTLGSDTRAPLAPGVVKPSRTGDELAGRPEQAI